MTARNRDLAPVRFSLTAKDAIEIYNAGRTQGSDEATSYEWVRDLLATGFANWRLLWYGVTIAVLRTVSTMTKNSLGGRAFSQS